MSGVRREPCSDVSRIGLGRSCVRVLDRERDVEGSESSFDIPAAANPNGRSDILCEDGENGKAKERTSPI